MLMDCDNVLENSLNLLTSFLISLLSFQSVFFSISTHECDDDDDNVLQQQKQQKQQDGDNDNDEKNNKESELFKLDKLYGIYHQLQITHSERCTAIALLEILTPSPCSSNYGSKNSNNNKSNIGGDGKNDDGSCNTSDRSITPSLIEDIHFVTIRACQRDSVIQFDSHCREVINELVIGFLQSGVNCYLQQNHHRQPFSPTTTSTSPISPISINSRSPSSSILAMKKTVMVAASEGGFDGFSSVSTKTNQDSFGRNNTRIVDDVDFLSSRFPQSNQFNSIHI